jgi:hypothetical protein
MARRMRGIRHWSDNKLNVYEVSRISRISLLRKPRPDRLAIQILITNNTGSDSLRKYRPNII